MRCTFEINEEKINKKDEEAVTRCGYKPGDSLRAYEAALLETGAVATGKTLHFSADILCSGGYDVWVRSLWEFAIDHVGVSSPRLFVYLKNFISLYFHLLFLSITKCLQSLLLR